MFLFLITPMIFIGYIWLFPILLIIEDQAYFQCELRDELDKDDWIAQLMGSDLILGKIIPRIYYALVAISIGLKLIFNLI